MDKTTLQRLIEQRKTIKQIALELNTSQTNVRYWLRKHGLKTVRGPNGKHPVDFVKQRKCKCGEKDPNNFYGQKQHVCKKCQNEYNLEKGRKQRKFIVDYLGGMCQGKNCFYKEYECSLDAHHKNPEEKDPSFESSRYWSKERLIKELDKCILLCKNCHTAHHNGYKIY